MYSRFKRWWGDLKAYRREHGWKGLARHVGWRGFLAFVVFYLIRDTILYILIPLAIWMGIRD